ncbi:MAG: hypothetical protein ABIJ05_01785, partial [Patescibacteria group bacterium]
MKKFFPIILIFILGLTIRFLSTYPANTIIGFDQARDLFDAKKIISGDIRIVGPTAGNNADLHHGVAFLYYIIPPMILGKSNPFWIVFWNSIFSSLIAVVLYFFTESLFKSKKAGFISAFLASISFYLIQYSGWLSNPTVTLFTVPLFFFGLWLYKEKFNWGLPLALFFLGLSIQFEIFFIYLIPIFILIWVLFKLKLPNIKTVIFSILSFCFATSTMIATEIKFNFSGIKSLISSTGSQQEVKNQFLKEFIERFFKTFSETVFPNRLNSGIIIGLLLLGLITFELINKRVNKQKKKALLFITIYLLSPLIMFLVGYHKAPWFLIGLPPAVILLSGYFLSKLKNVLLIPILILIAFFNLSYVKQNYGKGQVLLEPDSSALLSKQLEVIEYTYQKSEGKPFSINTVTNPLYINAIWGYNYSWYSKNYDYLPTWLGGDQEYPYNTLEKPKENEKMFFLIVDNSGRIPLVHILEAEKWAGKEGTLIETKDFEGI